MYKQLIARRQDLKDEEGGFTLIELLVVVVIIGILVAIAIPLYLHYRQGAEKDSAKSDTRNAIPALEQCYTDNNNTWSGVTTTPDPAVGTQAAPLVLNCGGTTAAPTTETIHVSGGNTMTVTLPTTAPSGGAYTIVTDNSDTGKTYTYASTVGQIVETDTNTTGG